jgi:DNA polymerase-3 subunit epsilon
MNPEATRNLLLVDLETTGPSPFLHSPLAVGLLPLLSEAPPLLVYVRPNDWTWSTFARTNFHRFSDEWENNAVSPAAAYELIETYVHSCFEDEPVTLVGHNVGFDISFLGKLAVLSGREGFKVFSHRSLDTHTMLYLLYLQDKVPRSALTSEGAFNHFGIEVAPGMRHTALGDVIATRILLSHVLRTFLGDTMSATDVANLDRFGARYPNRAR